MIIKPKINLYSPMCALWRRT